VTQADGTFAVGFTAKPDLAVSEKDDPTFAFTISAEVTDTPGETRTAQRNVNVGYTALKASLAADEWLTTQKAVEVRVTTQSPDGEPRAAEGGMKIHKLRQPEKVVRPRLDDDERGRRYAPPGADQAPEPDPANPDSWNSAKSPSSARSRLAVMERPR
jgi:hypothetical protein